jgi:hypothetical protein
MVLCIFQCQRVGLQVIAAVLLGAALVAGLSASVWLVAGLYLAAIMLSPLFALAAAWRDSAAERRRRRRLVPRARVVRLTR